MTEQIKINGITYNASMRRSKQRGDSPAYDVVFKPVDKSVKASVLIATNAITTREGFVGGGMGPFGSPHRQVKIYCIKGWGDGESVGQREYEAIARQWKITGIRMSPQDDGKVFYTPWYGDADGDYGNPVSPQVAFSAMRQGAWVDVVINDADNDNVFEGRIQKLVYG